MHNADVFAHAAMRDHYRQQFRLDQQDQDRDVWKALDSLRLEVNANTRWRYIQGGGLAVLSLLASAAAFALATHLIH